MEVTDYNRYEFYSQKIIIRQVIQYLFFLMCRLKKRFNLHE